MAKYGKSASKNVESAMRRKKKGTLRNGAEQKVKSRKQAIAIGLSEAREKGAKVPAPPKKTAKKHAGRTRAAKKTLRERLREEARHGSAAGLRKPDRGPPARALVRPSTARVSCALWWAPR